MSVNTLNFRHVLGFLSTMPFGYSSEKYLKNYFVNMTTNNLKVLFPFYTDTIIEKNGILIGNVKNDKKICVIDLFSKSHLNSNICIFGSSGSGKSYFTKLLILRNYLKNVKQYIIDQEGEYTNIPGCIFDINTSKLNLFQLQESEIVENFFYKKVDKVTNFICKICNFDEERQIIKDAVIEEYNNHQITEDINSIYEVTDIIYLNKKIKDKSEFPIIEDLILRIQKDKNIKKSIKTEIVNKMKEKFNGIFLFLNGTTTVNIDLQTVVFDISDVNVKQRGEVCSFLLNYIKGNLTQDIPSLIYIDEVWKIINQNDELSTIVFDLYKTVRKRNCGIITITQDVSDIFGKNNGNFGKSILNNSYLKIFFKMEYNDSVILDNIGIIEKDDYEKIVALKKGEMLMYIQNSNLTLDVQSNDYERKIIEGEI